MDKYSTILFLLVFLASVVHAAGPGDSDGDGKVGLSDLIIIGANWGLTDFDPRADLNGDGSVGLADLILVGANFGNTYENETQCVPGESCPSNGTDTDENLLVAILGDQSLSSSAVAVLEMIRDEGTDMVIHSGDFDYEDDPTRWDDMITGVLGDDFPYFSDVGNHDVDAWGGSSGYQQKIADRMSRIAGASCSGDIGLKSHCTYRGLFMVLSGIGTLGSDHESYIEDALAGSNHTWKICSWHKNQEAMQIGGKTDEVGWGAYEMCRQAGAFIVTGHEHSYERTHALSNIQDQVVADDSSPYTIRPGQTIVVVSGLAGASIRDQERCLPTTPPYGCDGEWANIYTSDQDAQYGVLFCSFHVDGDPNKAHCYFKDIDGNIPDDFVMLKEN